MEVLSKEKHSDVMNALKEFFAVNGVDPPNAMGICMSFALWVLISSSKDEAMVKTLTDDFLAEFKRATKKK